jgi:hypothetical protein
MLKPFAFGFCDWPGSPDQENGTRADWLVVLPEVPDVPLPLPELSVEPEVLSVVDAKGPDRNPAVTCWLNCDALLMYSGAPLLLMYSPGPSYGDPAEYVFAVWLPTPVDVCPTFVPGGTVVPVGWVAPDEPVELAEVTDDVDVPEEEDSDDVEVLPLPDAPEFEDVLSD